MKWFLVWRDKRGLRKIEVFEAEEEQAAMAAYADAESWNVNQGNLEMEEDVCLFGSDSVATLCRTHASWLDPGGYMQDFLDTVRSPYLPD